MSASALLAPDKTVLRTLGRDQRLFSQGDRSTAIFCVEHGAVRLERRTFDGRLVTLHTGRPGELLAEASLFSDTYHCDARAISPSQVRVYPKAALLRAVREQPGAAETLLATFARQVRALRLRLELRNVRSAKERLMLYLELNADPATRTVLLDHPLQDIAADLGLSRETIYRSLATLQAKGLIRRGRGSVTLVRTPA